jgi:DMSO reductase anchor subunit
LFGVGWLFTALDNAIWRVAVFELSAVTAIFGLGLIHNMAQVYRIPAAPGWNSWRTNLGFMVSALLLGISGMALLLVYEANSAGIQIPAIYWTKLDGSILLLLVIQSGLMRRKSIPVDAVRMRIVFAGVMIVLIGLIQPGLHIISMNAVIFLCVVSEELIGRWVFYQSRM